MIQNKQTITLNVHQCLTQQASLCQVLWENTREHLELLLSELPIDGLRQLSIQCAHNVFSMNHVFLLLPLPHWEVSLSPQ
jgi:hypothetical protein